jgi:hypothetical protein
MVHVTSSEPLQLGLEGMPRRLFACTPSRLQSWLDCPRRYRMTYVERPGTPRGQAWAHTTMGAAVHVALARWWSGPRDRRTPAVARTLLERAWPQHGTVPDGFADAAQSDRWRERAADMVERYAPSLDPGRRAARRRAHRVDAHRTALVLSGRGSTGSTCADASSSSSTSRPDSAPDRPPDARGPLALALYAVAAGPCAATPCRRVELHHLPSGRVAAVEHDGRLAPGPPSDRAEAGGGRGGGRDRGPRRGGDADVLFPPRTSPAARGATTCAPARGRAAAGPPRRPWDGLPDEAA